MVNLLNIIPIIISSTSTFYSLNNHSFLEQNNFYYENSNLIIKGNISILDSSKYLDNIINKDLLIFDINSKIDDSYFAFFYDYESNSTYFLETNSSNLIDLESDLNTFYNEYNIIENTNSLKLISSNSNNFKEIKSSTISKVAKPYGRMAFTYTLSEYEFSSASSLYLLEVRQQFISGYNCLENDEVGYEAYYNDNEYVHIGVYQTSAEMGYDDIIKSGIPKFKDAYPVATPSTVTISSSYEAGTTIAYSFKNGISFDGISVEGETEVGLNVEYGYSKSYTTTNPRVSSQLGENLSEFLWNYYYQDPDEVTNYQVLGYIFECNRYQNGLDVHNKFGINLSAKAKFSTKEGTESYSVSFLRSIY